MDQVGSSPTREAASRFSGLKLSGKHLPHLVVLSWLVFTIGMTAVRWLFWPGFALITVSGFLIQYRLLKFLSAKMRARSDNSEIS